MLENEATGGDDETTTGAQAGDSGQVADKPAAKKTAKKAAKKTATKKVAAKKATAKKAARKSATKAAQPEPLPLDGVDTPDQANEPGKAALSAESPPATADTADAATSEAAAESGPTTSRTRTRTRRATRGAGAPAADAAGQETAQAAGADGGTPAEASDQAQATTTGGGRTRSARSGRGRSRAAGEASEQGQSGAQAEASEQGQGGAQADVSEQGQGAIADGGAKAETSGLGAAEAPAQAGRTARRRGASRPAGPPEPVEDPLAAVFLPPRPVTPAPAVDEDDTTDTTDSAETADAPPARTARKRGSRKAAVRTPRDDDAADTADTAEPPADAAQAGTDDQDTDTSAESADVDDDDEDDDRPRRRRRRGGRGRRRRSGQRDGDATAQDGDDKDDDKDADDAQDTAADSAEGESDGDAEGDEQRASSRRRRRRRRRGGGGGGSDEAEPSPDDPPNTVVKVRQPRESDRNDEVTALKGSTRLEAKRQRRREGRDPGRRRVPVLSESEFLARREAVDRVMVIRQIGDRTQIAILEDGVLVEHYVERGTGQSYVGNVYLGRVQNVLPSMEAAFIDIGRGRNAVLYAGEVNFAGFDMGNQPKRIESVLKSGQSVLVQVTKGPVGQKGARLTSQIGLPGRYLVYSPEGASAGISRKLPDKERERLKAVLKKTLPEDGGVIVRTAAEGASEEELSRDVSRLVAQWEAIQSKAKSANAPALLNEEPDLTVRVIRDAFNEDFNKLVVAGDDSWQMIEPYVQHVAPHLAERVEKWTDAKDVFNAYRIDEQLAKALDRKVYLPSGGSLVIDRTEAMTVIDVNTGKFTGQGGNLEETVTRNNLEAAEELVRQLRLRDIGGIVVVDFIDMVLESNRDLVLRRLVECLARDRTRHQVAEVTSLGLVQMTRKRIGQGLLEAFSKPCDCCDGRGLHVSLEPVEPEQRGNGGGGGGGGGGNRGGKGKGKKNNQNQQKDQGKERSDAPEKIAAIAAASG